jgi:hypothetical protein
LHQAKGESFVNKPVYSGGTNGRMIDGIIVTAGGLLGAVTGFLANALLACMREKQEEEAKALGFRA